MRQGRLVSKRCLPIETAAHARRPGVVALIRDYAGREAGAGNLPEVALNPKALESERVLQADYGCPSTGDHPNAVPHNQLRVKNLRMWPFSCLTASKNGPSTVENAGQPPPHGAGHLSTLRDREMSRQGDANCRVLGAPGFLGRRHAAWAWAWERCSEESFAARVQEFVGQEQAAVAAFLSEPSVNRLGRGARELRG